MDNNLENNKTRFYLVDYTRKLSGNSNKRIRTHNVKVSERDLKLILEDTSKFEYIILKAKLILE